MQRKEKSEFTYGIKLSPEHFPVGTLFKVDPTLSDDAYKDTIFEATGYTYNTPNHFVITTTHWNKACEVHDAYSHTHIREIVKRGDGPIVDMNEVRARDRQKGKKGDNTNQFGAAHSYGVEKKEKTHYIFFDAESVFHQRMARRFKKPLAKGVVFDVDLFAGLLMKQSFVKSVGVGSNGWRSFLYVASKKRLDKWLKQNLNRFLIPVKKAQQEYEKMMDEIYQQDFERDMGYDLDVDVPGEDDISTEIPPLGNRTLIMHDRPKEEPVTPSQKEMLDKIVEKVKNMSPEEFEQALERAQIGEVATALREIEEAVHFAAHHDILPLGDGTGVTNPAPIYTEGRVKNPATTGRYSIGEEIYAMAYIYGHDFDMHSSCLRPLTWLQTTTPKEVKFIKLTVKEHHKVPIDFSDDLGDGYILETDDPNVKYLNQYPVASYGQTTDTGNRVFTLDMRAKDMAHMEEMVENEANHPWQWINITDHVSDIYVAAHGKDRETMIQANPDRHQQLVDIYKMINDTFEAQFPGKQLKIVPITLKRKDGTVETYPDILTTTVVDKA